MSVSFIDGHIDEPKMTDNEIIKALECCVFKTTDKCDKCILTRYGNDCKKLGVYALDLINRQKAEIEELKKGINIELENYASEYDNKIKVEAVKEFAENLETALSDHFGGGFYKCHCRHVIDNLLKETMGDADDFSNRAL